MTGKYKKRSRDVEDDESSQEEVQTTKSSKKAKTSSGGAGKDSDGNPFWAFSGNGKRRITISDFKKNDYVNIREYYEDQSGEMKPGKKGISLSVEQYEAILKLIPQINAELRSRGHDIQDNSSGSAADPSLSESKSDVKKEKKAKQKLQKSNFEATSDEDTD